MRPAADHAPDRRERAIAAIAHATAPAPTASTGAHATASAPTDSTVPALTDAAPVIGLIDLDEVDQTFARLRAAFASDSSVLHAVAGKAVPLRSLLRRFAEAGAGCEVASPGELELTLAAGFAPETIVFDSPAKTMSELRRALDLGVSINVDGWEELDRLDLLMAERGNRTDHADGTPTSVIGVRINPQSGLGEIGSLSTATETSKFGIGLTDPGARDALIRAFLARPWLTQVHVHSGSQGISLDQLAAGVAAAVDLAREINSDVTARDSDTATPTPDPRQVTRIDIGGGLPVNFSGDEVTPTFADYRAVLAAQVPGLADFAIVTEFGRSLLAKAGTILTRVEYAKTTGRRRIAITHAGVQVATRTAYAPADWPLRILPFAPDGTPKLAEEVPTDVAGPACFAGDLLAENRRLPRLDAGDLVAVPDTGAYYFSNPFSYNLLPRVPVYGYRTTTPTTVHPTAGTQAGAGSGDTETAGRLGGGGVEFSLLRRGQTVSQILAEVDEPEFAPGSGAADSRR